MLFLDNAFKTVSAPVGDDLFKSLAAKQKKTNWECDSCMTQNDASKEKCLCCETPKPGSVVKTSSSIPVVTGSSFSFGMPQTKTDQDVLFKSLAAKQKTAQWECDSCMTRNDASKDKCLCCEAQKPGTTATVAAAKTSSFSFGMQASKPNSEPPKFSFGVPSENVKNSTSLQDVGFKSLLDKQNANWECTACFTRNDQLKLKCVCCEQQKPGSATETTSQFSFGSKSSGIILPAAADVKFSFGMPAVKVSVAEDNTNVLSKPIKDSFGSVSNNIVPTLDVAAEKSITVPSINSSTTPANSTFSFKAPTSNEVSASFSFKAPVIDVLKENESKVVPEKSIEKELPEFTFGKRPAVSKDVVDEIKITPSFSTQSKGFGNSTVVVEEAVAKKSDSGAFSFGSTTNSTTTSSLNKNGGFSFGGFTTTSEPTTKSSLTTTTPQAMPSITSGFSFGSNNSPLANKPKASPIVFGSSSLTPQPPASNVLATSAANTMPAASTFQFGGATKDSTEHSKTFGSFGMSGPQGVAIPHTNAFAQGSNNKSFGFSNSTKPELPTPSASTAGAFTFGAQNKTSEPPAAGNSMLFGSGNSQSALQSVTPVFGANTASATFGTFGATSAPTNNINNNNESGFGSKMPSFGSSFGNTNNNASQTNNQKPAFQFGISEDPAAKKLMPSFGFSSQPVQQPLQNQQQQQQQQQNTVIFLIAINVRIIDANKCCLLSGSIPIRCPKRRK